MSQTLSKLNIVTGNVIQALDVYQIVDALTYQKAYDLYVSGSISVGSGSIPPGLKMYISGNFKVDGATYVQASDSKTGNILYYDTASGLLSYGNEISYVNTQSYNQFVANYTAFSSSYSSDSASFDSRIASQSVIVSASVQYTGRSPATRQVGGINVGDDLTVYSLNTLLQQIVAPYTAPTISLVSLSPTNSPYNQTNVTYNVTFNWHQNVGTPAFTSASIQYQRNGDTLWNALTTTTSGTGSSVNASATVTLNTSGPDNRSVLFKGVFTDSMTNSSSIATSTFSAYASPTLVMNNTYTPAPSAYGYALRSVTTAYQALITGSITQNSPNIPISQYKISRDYNDNVWVDLIPLTSIGSSGGPIAPITDSAQPAGKSTVRYIGYITDTQVPAGQYVNYISSENIYNPVFYGMTTATSIGAVNFTTMGVVPSGNGSGQIVYQNNSNDKTVNGLQFTASSNRFFIAWDNSYGNPVKFFDTGTNLNLIGNFTIGTTNVTFADGTVKTYVAALYNLVVVSGTYTINIG